MHEEGEEVEEPLGGRVDEGQHIGEPGLGCARDEARHLGHLSSTDGILHHEQRGALYRGDDGAAHLRLSFIFDENPFPDVYAGGGSGDSCTGCSGAFDLAVESRWEAGESTPRGHVHLLENGTLLGEVGAF
ncbi:uncharacterized protein SOCE26_031290 [Sorangium cellulosum]|uniref:Uncharacterized protein n=1 Tax=Sorangium cellulosum TaxID=56 RepID=A0A2L0EQW7_SORCE|nr:hypothetical protein [Sorangium cellulosum]AUX41707.1 uncharacterized protein SOCE26_031290 [Sorangium cellulosum]